MRIPYWTEHNGEKASIGFHERWTYIRHVSPLVAEWRRPNGRKAFANTLTGRLWPFRGHFGRRLAWVQAQTKMTGWPQRYCAAPPKPGDFIGLEDWPTGIYVGVREPTARALLTALRLLTRRVKKYEQQLRRKGRNSNEATKTK
jgi:hypothetical protein